MYYKALAYTRTFLHKQIIYIAEMFKDWGNKINSGLSVWQNVKTKTNTLLYTRNLIMTEYDVIR